MENASKALLIAGAILVAILLIGIGMAVFGNIGGITDGASQQTDSMEIKMFNDKFEHYAGPNVSGTNVKELIREIKASNIKFANDESRIIAIDGITADTNGNYSIGANYRYSVTFDYEASGFINKVTINKV